MLEHTEKELEHIEKEMKRLRENVLQQMPSNLCHDVPGGVKLLHINIGNFNRKMIAFYV